MTPVVRDGWLFGWDPSEPPEDAPLTTADDDPRDWSVTAGEAYPSDLVIREFGEPVEVMRFDGDNAYFVFDSSGPSGASDGPYEEYLTIAVAIPHPDARLVSCGPTHDGEWRVVMMDSRGVGVDHIVTGFGPDALSASRSVADRLVAAIEARAAREAELESASAARRRALTPGSGVIPGAAKPARAAAAGVAKPTRAGGGVPYAGSVPRNASQWLVEIDGVHVSLHAGLAWADTMTREDRVFKTIRLAKDATRGAVRE